MGDLTISVPAEHSAYLRRRVLSFLASHGSGVLGSVESAESWDDVEEGLSLVNASERMLHHLGWDAEPGRIEATAPADYWRELVEEARIWSLEEITGEEEGVAPRQTAVLRAIVARLEFIDSVEARIDATPA